MGSNEPDVNVVVGAETSGVEAGMHRAAGVVDSAMEAMKGSTGALGFAIGAVSGIVGELTHQALVALGEGLKNAAAKFSELTVEVEKFSQATGMSMEDASIMSDSLNDIGVKTGTYEQLINQTSRAIRTKSEAFDRLGIKIKDTSTGALLPMNDIIKNSVDRLSQFKAGTDRNMASMELFRRNWSELAPLMRVNEELLRDNAEAADRFGMIVGEKDVQAQRALQLATADAVKPLEGMWVVIGRSLNPLLIELAGIMQGVLTFSFDVVTGAIRGVMTFFEGLQNGLYTLAETVIMTGNVLGTAFTAIGEAADKALHGDFSGAKDAIKNGFAGMEKDVKQSFDNITEHSRNTAERIRNMWMGGKLGQPQTSSGTDTYTPKSKNDKGSKDKGDFSEWRKELQEMKDEADVFRGMDLTAEKAFWVAKLALVRAGSENEAEDRRSVQHEIAQIERKEAQESLKAALAALEAKKESVAKHKDEVIQIETARVALMEAIYGKDSKQYQEALRAKLKAERDYQEERKQLQEQALGHQKALSDLQMTAQREEIDFQRDMGFITGEQRIAALRNVLAQEHNMEMETLRARAALEEEGSLKHQQTLNQMELAEQQYSLRVRQLQMEQARETAATWDKLIGTVTSAIETSVKGVIMGTTTMQKALSNIWTAILGEFISFLAKKLAAWLRTLIMEKILQQTFGNEASAGMLASAIAEIAVVKTKAMAEISAYAGIAGAAATASAAAIPYVGWMIAPEAGATAFAAAMSYQAAAAGVGFAVGSWNVPQDMVTKVHKGETIMPAEFAEKYREGGEGGGAVHLHLQTMDVKGVKDFLKSNSSVLGPALRRQARNFAPRSTTSALGKVF